MPKDRFLLNCGGCKDKEGACIQCDYKSCTKSYHVRCATRNGIIESWEKMIDALECPTETDTPIFCLEHRKDGLREFKKKLMKKANKEPTKKAKAPAEPVITK